MIAAAGLTLVALLVGLFVAIMLAGMLSAAYDVHLERKAGVPVTRPGWERDRYGRGLAYARGLWKGLRS